MDAPQKRARDEEAATERPNKRYKCEPSLDTAAKQEDLSALSKPELRALVASARALARRADGEIAARQASFPRCLPPQFVMAWLPLGASRPASSQASACERFAALSAMSRARPCMFCTPPPLR